MENQLFQDVPANEREQYLKDSAYRIETDEYLKRLSPEERAEKQEQLSKLQSKILSEENEKKETVKQFTEAIKDMKGENKELVQTLSRNAELITGEVFLIPDESTRMMGIYSRDGELIRSRPMSTDEMQKSIFELRKAD